jgi:lactoylglutathione lyase
VSDATYELRPRAPRWTHVALRVRDLDASIAFYTEFTTLEVLANNQDAMGRGVWLAHPDQAENPFVLVLAEFIEATDPFAGHPFQSLTPFAHLGIELPTREALDEIAARGEAAGCLAMPPQQMPPPVGYVCMLEDPDGNRVEYSYDQGVYAAAQEKWGSGS